MPLRTAFIIDKGQYHSRILQVFFITTLTAADPIVLQGLMKEKPYTLAFLREGLSLAVKYSCLLFP
jgi:hypothetical protein